MKQALLTIMFLYLSSNATASLEAIEVDISAPIQSFESFSYNGNVWQNSNTNTSNVSAAEYRYGFYLRDLKETIAIGFAEKNGINIFIAACKKDGETTWHDCSPTPEEMAEGNYKSYIRPAHDGNSSLMLVGIKNTSDETLIASCRNDIGKWSDCSPPPEDVQHFAYYNLMARYGNGKWMVISDLAPWKDGYGINHAFCMNAEIFHWESCDIKINFPTPTWRGIIDAQYLAEEQQWIAIGTHFDESIEEDVFHSLCFKENEVGSECTGELKSITPYMSLRLMQNDHGELLALHDSYEPNNIPGAWPSSTRALCRFPRSTWKDCSANLNDLPNQDYEAIVVNEEGQWVLIGSQPDEALRKNTAYLTATLNDGQWNIVSQPVTNENSIFIDAYYSE